MTETTFILVKPDAYPRADDVLSCLAVLLSATLRGSVSFVGRESLVLTRDQVRNVWGQAMLTKMTQDYAGRFVDFMTSGPCLIVFLAGDDAVSRVRSVVGATDAHRQKKPPHPTLRSLFGDLSDDAPVYRNAVHAPDSPEAVAEEAAFLLPATWPRYFSFGARRRDLALEFVEADPFRIRIRRD